MMHGVRRVIWLILTLILFLCVMDSGEWLMGAEAQDQHPRRETIQLITIEIDPAPPINITNRGSVNVTVSFGEDMNTSVQPNVTSGLPPNYDNITFSGSWKNSTTWAGNAVFPLKIFDGIHKIKVSNAKNASGYTIPENYSSPFIVDTEPPVATVEALPRFITVKTFKVFTGCWDRTSGIHSVELWYNFNKTGWTFHAIDSAPPFEWDFTPPGEGPYEFSAVATDNASNREDIPLSNESWTTVDYTPPVSRAQPIGRAVHGWNITVNATAYDAYGVSMVELWFSKDHGPWVIYGRDSAPPWQWDLNISMEGSGSYELSTRAFDQASLYEDLHEKNDTWVYFDTGRPDTRVKPLSSRYVNTRSFKLNIDLGKNPWMINHTEVWSNDSTGWRLAGITYDNEFTFNAPSDGRYEFFSIGVRRSGEREVPPSANDTWVVVDTSPPNLTTSPKNGTSNTPLTASIYLNFSEPVLLDPREDLKISPGINYTTSGTPSRITITPSHPLTPLTRYTITVKGHDYAGNPFFYSFWFTTKQAPPPRIASTYPRQGDRVVSFTSLYLNFTEKMNPGTSSGVHIISGTGGVLKDPRWTGEKSLVFKVESAGVGSYVIVVDATYAMSQDGIRLDGNGDGTPGDNYTLIFSVIPPPVQNGSIAGITRDIRGNAIPFVEIRLSRNGTPILNTTSGFSGEFEITNLEPGRYHLEASKEMFRSVAVDIDVYPGKPSYVILTLEFKNDVSIEGYAAFIAVSIILMIAVGYALRENLKGRFSLFKKKIKKRRKETHQARKGVELTGKALDHSTVLLEWDPVDCEGYSLYISKDGKRFEHLVEIPKRMKSYIHEKLKPGSTIWYRLDTRYPGEVTIRGNAVKVTLPEKG